MHQKYPTTSTNCSISAIVSEKSKTSFMRKLMAPLIVAFAFMVGIPNVGYGQILYSSSASSTWLTAANWTGSAVPSSSQIAQVGANPSGTTIGINFNSTTNAGTQSTGNRIEDLGALEITSARAAALIIGNSSTTTNANGQFRPYGISVNSIQNTIITNGSSQLLTIQNISGSGTQLMGLTLVNSNDNVININGTGGVTISSIISGTAKLSLNGAASSGALTLSGTNTFTGGFNLNTSNSSLNINSAAALGTTAGTFTISGGKIDNTSGGSITTSNYPQSWAGDFTFTGTNALSLGTGNVTLGATRQVTVTASTLTVGGVISGSGFGITKAGAGLLLLTNAANTYSGTTTITAGDFRLNPSTTTASLATPITLNGGTLSTTGIAASTTITNSSTLNLANSSTIALDGTNAHSLKFAASNGVSWTSSKTITITGWTGTAGSSGTKGKIFIGTDATGLTASQLAEISFTGFSNGTMILSTGEVVPAPATLPATLTTTAAASITNTGATLAGNISATGGATITADGVVFATYANNSNPQIGGSNVTNTAATTIQSGAFSISPTLSPNTRYAYNAYATNSVGTSYGTVGTFYTLSNPPTAQPSSFSTTAGSTSLTVNWNAATFPVSGATQAGYLVIWAASGTTPALSSANGTAPVASAGTIVNVTTASSLNPAVTTSISGLSNGTTYNLLLIPYTWDGSNAATYNYLTSSALTTTGTPVAPAFPTLGISGTPTDFGSICPNNSTSTVQYTISNTGAASAAGILVSSSDPQFVVSALSSTTIAASGTATFNVAFTPSSGGAKSTTITVSSTTSGSNSPTIGLTGTGTTVVTPVVVSSSASSIVNTTATLNGSVTTLGICPATTEKGFVYSLTSANANPIVNGSGVIKTAVAGLATGSYTLALSSLTPGSGYSFKAYLFDGTTYTYSSVTTFSTLTAATKLVFSVAPPSTGSVSTNLTSFTVQAQRADNSVDGEYNANITVSKATGTGNLTGSTTVAATAGVAAFSAVQFDAASTFTISASSGSLTTATSGNIVITLVNATAILWSNSGGSAWLTNTNWTGSTIPTSAQVAQFALNPTAISNSLGINLGSTTNNGTSNEIAGAVEVTSARTTALQIGNSSGSTNGVLTLSGVNVNSVSNVIIRNNSSGDLTFQANQNSLLGLVLGNATNNIINIDSSGGVIITSVISGANPLTKAGSGSGVLTLGSAANTYTGATTVTTGELRFNPSSTTATFASPIILNGGSLATTGITANTTLTSSSTLQVNTNTTLALGTASHNLKFANSSAVSWSASSLTITGWNGSSGRLFFGTDATGLSAGQLSKITIAGYSGNPILTSSGELVPLAPILYGAATATAFTTTYGTASTAKTFAVSGTGLTANIVATAPTGFEVSSDGTTYGSTATFTQSAGSASGTLYVRLTATATVSGTYNSVNIPLSSTGAVSINITTAASGNTITAKGLTITGIGVANKTYDGNANGTITGTPVLSGIINSDVVTVGGTPTATFASSAIANNVSVTIAGYLLSGAGASNYSLTQPTGFTANITPYYVPMASQASYTYSEGFTDIANWTDAFAAGTGANAWGSVATNSSGSIPDGVKITSSTATFATSGSSTGIQRGSLSGNVAGTLVFLGSGSTDNTTSIAADFRMDFTGVNAGNLSFTAAEVTNSTGNRVGTLQVYYSTNGTSFTALSGATFVATNNVAGSSNISVSLPSAFNTISTCYLRFYYSNGTGGTTGSRPKISIDNLVVTAVAIPQIATSGTPLSAVSTTYGTASSTTNFNVSGTNMTAGITVTPPVGFEVSTSSSFVSNIGSHASPIVVGAAGTISSTPVYVRLAATSTVAASPYSGNIVLSTTGGSSVNVATVSSSVSSKSLTITANNVSKASGATLSNVASSTAFTSSGLVGSETIGTVSIAYGTGAASNAADGVYTGSVTPSAATGGTFTASNYSISYVSGNITVTTPSVISTTGTLSVLSTTYGTASSTTSFNVSATGLVDDITITPPSGFEVSTSSSFASNVGTSLSPLVILQSGATLSSTTVWVRLSGTASVLGSPYSGNIVLTSAAATDVNVATASSTVAAKALTITANNVNKVYNTALTGAAGSTAFTSSGLVNSETIGTVTIAYGTGADSSANVATYSGSVTPSAAVGGTFTASNYSITYALGNIVVTQANQTITFNALVPIPVGTAPYIIRATSSASSLKASFTSSNTSVATISDSTITIVGVGSTNITAIQSGNSNYSAATSVVQQLKVTEPVIASWNFTGSGSGSASPSSSAVSNLTVSAITAGNPFGTAPALLSATSPSTTVAATPTSYGYTASGTYNVENAANSGALDVTTTTNAYFEFTLTPASGYTISLSSFSFANRSTGTGPVSYVLRSSIDNYASNLATGSLLTNSTWALNSNTNTLTLTTPPGDGTNGYTFRIYGYGGAGAGTGTVNWRVDDITVNGSVVFNPSPIITTSVSSFGTAFSQTSATPSTSQSYTISGQYLDNDIIVTPPVGYEVSTSSGFSSTIGTNLSPLTLTKSGASLIGGTVTVYVRLNTSSPGTSAGNIVNSTINATTLTAVTKSIAVTGSRIVNYYNKFTGNVDILSSWSTNSNGGGGTSPANFTSDGQIFNVKNGTASLSASTAWSVSGSGSKIVLGDGTNAVSLTVPSSSTITGTIDLANKGTLVLQNTSLTHTYGTIATGSTIEYAQASAYSIPMVPQTGLNYGNLTLSGTGKKTFLGSATAPTFTLINGNLTLNGATYDAPGSTPFGIINLAGNLIQTGTVTPPADANSITLSMVGTAGSTQTITGDGVSPIRWFSVKANAGNSTTIKLVKTGATNVNLKVGNATGGGITLVAGSVLDLNGNDLTYANVSGVGGASLPAAGTISTTSTSTINLFKSVNTAGLGTLNLTSGSNTLGNLTINYTGTFATALTLGTAVNLTGVLTVTAGAFNTGGLLTLKSTSIANSAIVAPVVGSITGTATVERFIPKGFRAYRDISAGGVYSASNYLYNTWQESGSYTKAGYGLFITGALDTTTRHNVVDGSSGLDHSITGSPSAFYYKAGWDTIWNTKSERLNPYQSYRVLIRGDRSFDLDTTPIFALAGPTVLAMNGATTLEASGSLITGNVVYSRSGVSNAISNPTYNSATYGLNPASNSYTYIANPYACPIDFQHIYNNSGLTNLHPFYYYLDPTIGSTGAWVVYNAESNVSTKWGLNHNGEFIQAGQGFLIKDTSSGAPVLTITEQDKSILSTSKTSIFGTTTTNSGLGVNLLKLSGSSYLKMDGAYIVFGTKFSNGVGIEDAAKMSNASDNLSIVEGGKNLSIDGRLPATKSDILPIGLAQMSTTTYKLVIDASQFTGNGVSAYLQDTYKNTSVALATAVDTIDFAVDTKATASYLNRFSIVFKPTTLAVNSIVASATANGNVATIKWNTVGENAVSTFDVEKSTDGTNFNKIGEVAAKNTANASYFTTDNSATAASNYYRIKALSNDGSINYSNIAKVTYNLELTTYNLYPNPLVGKTLNVQLNNAIAGSYVVSIINALGQKVAETTITHAGGVETHALTIKQVIATGVYNVTIRSVDSKQQLSTSTLTVN